MGPFLILDRREGVSGDFIGDFGCELESDGHSQVSGGRHEYCCLPLGATDQPSALTDISSLSTGVADFSVSWDLGTGNSNVSVAEDLLKLVWKAGQRRTTYIVDGESLIWIGIVPAADM